MAGTTLADGGHRWKIKKNKKIEQIKKPQVERIFFNEKNYRRI